MWIFPFYFFFFKNTFANLVAIAVPQSAPDVIGCKTNPNPVTLSLSEVLIDPMLLSESLLLKTKLLFLRLLYFL